MMVSRSSRLGEDAGDGRSAAEGNAAGAHAVTVFDANKIRLLLSHLDCGVRDDPLVGRWSVLAEQVDAGRSTKLERSNCDHATSLCWRKEQNVPTYYRHECEG